MRETNIRCKNVSFHVHCLIRPFAFEEPLNKSHGSYEKIVHLSKCPCHWFVGFPDHSLGMEWKNHLWKKQVLKRDGRGERVQN